MDLLSSIQLAELPSRFSTNVHHGSWVSPIPALEFAKSSFHFHNESKYLPLDLPCERPRRHVFVKYKRGHPGASRNTHEGCSHENHTVCIAGWFFLRVAIGLLFVSTAFPNEPARDAAPADVLLIAHRGGVVDEGRIENNLPAIEEAVARGYFMLEVDLRESRDGHLVVQHDEDFRRFYGDARRVDELTWGKIQQLRSSPGELRPMDFAEYASACRDKIRLMLDTKGPDHDESFFSEMLRILRENDLLEDAFVIGTAVQTGLLW